MSKTYILTVAVFICLAILCPRQVVAQQPVVRNAVYSDVSLPLRDIKPIKDNFWKKWLPQGEHEIPNKFRKPSSVKVIDHALQTDYYTDNKVTLAIPIVNFDGLSNQDNFDGRVTPPDPAGDVGPNHYVQAVNCMLQVYDKAGNSVYGPIKTATIWDGFSGNWTDHNDGDAIILYDENADRWIISQFAIDCPGSPKTEYQLVAVSTTSDPTGSYNRYAFQFDFLPDYGKPGVWPDGYYLSVNRYNTNIESKPFIGVGACVLERSKMLAGDPEARMIFFKTETLGGSGSATGSNCYSMLPADCDGIFPSEGTPNYFTYVDTSAELRIWALLADWTTPGNSTFTYITALPVAPYNELGTVSQPNPVINLDGLGDRLMFRNQYRNFGGYETFVTCHNVDVGNGRAGLRWYEYRKSGSEFSLHQQSTYAPDDGKSRWMGSIAMNAAGDIGMAYSVSGTTTYPSIYYTGRKAGDPLNQLTKPEGIIHAGTTAMTGLYGRWGDYTAMNIDPSDSQTFWTTQEYVGNYGGSYPWATKIASFQFPDIPIATTVAATEITSTSARLNGTVNPYGLATDYYFEWGTTLSYGNATALVSAGSGNLEVAVNTSVSGLYSDTTYHFRIVATNSDGTSKGSDLTFIPGAPVLITNAISSVTIISAMGGGIITSDGGKPVIERGVCWATTANPEISGNHTSDGSGTGIFSSSITGLTSNMLYHIRAYATNSSGTYYGEDITFTTLCETVSNFPWNEGFENSGAMPNCWSQEQVEGSGINWAFIPGSGTSHPASSHGGTYNASLNDFTTADSKTMLITPTLNMESLSSPVLTFWHTQAAWSDDQDELSLFYKTAVDSSWQILQTYTNSTETWTRETIILPNKSSEYVIAFEGNAKWGYGVCIDDINISGTNISIWGGTVNHDWNTPGNWILNEVPQASHTVIIPSAGITNFPVLTSSVIQCADLTILSGANIHINPGEALTVTGVLTNKNGYDGLVIESDSSGTGSLLHNTANVPATIERYITGSNSVSIQKYNFVSIPLSTQNTGAGNLFPGANVYEFDENTNDWIPYSSELAFALNETKGYSLYYPGENITYPIKGHMNNDDFTPMVTWTKSQGPARGWNLIPNPYPSSINWDLVTTRNNVDNAIYIWPEAAPGNSSNYYQYAGGVSNPEGALNGQIGVGQSFFVHASSIAPSITLTNASRVHGDGLFVKNDSIIPNVLYLEASTSDSKDFAAIRFTWNASPEFDSNLDAYKLAGGSDAPQLSSVTANGTRLSINSLPISNDNIWVPLHFELNSSANVTFKASGMESFINDMPVYLEDHLLSGTINLSRQPEYTFAHTPTNSPDRFVLVFIGPYGVEQAIAQTEGKVYISGDFVFADIPAMDQMPVQITISDVLGRQFSSITEKMVGVTKFPAPGTPGIYVVRAISGSKIFVGKVVVR